MLSYFRWVLFFVAMFATLMGGALFLGNTLLNAPGPLDKTKNVVIPRGAGPVTMAKVLQDFVKKTIAPYKYPRAVEFLSALPRTETGKLQRFVLRKMP